MTHLALLLCSLLTSTASAPAPTSDRASTSAAPRLPRNAEDRVTVLRGVTLWIGDGTVVEAGALEFRGDTITRVGPASAIEAPEGAKVIEFDGKIVTPGFIAASTELGLREIDYEDQTRDDAPETEDAHPIRAAYNPAWGLHANSSVLAIQAIEGITTAAVTPTGGLIPGQVTWIDVLPGAHEGLVAERSTAMAATLGDTLAGSRVATMAKLDEVFDDARFYGRNRRDFDRARARPLAAHRLDLEALQPVLAGEIPLVVAAHRASDILAALAFAKRWNLRIAIVGGSQAGEVAEALAAAEVPVIVQPSQNLPGSLDQLGARRDLAARLHRAGVPVGIAVLDDMHNVRNVRQEAGIAIAHGLPREVAQRAVTLAIAEAYGMDRRYGTLAPGKVASLVVWDGDPFELGSFPTRVYVRGSGLAMRSRQTELRDRYLRRLGLGG